MAIRIIDFWLIILIQMILPFVICAQGIIIPTGTFIVGSTAYIIDYSNFTNNASNAAFTHNGLFTFAGSTQSIGGTAGSTFNNVTVNAGSTTTIATSGQQISNILLCNATLNAGGNLTLLASASKTALVDGSGSGTISGTLINQGYIATAFGYHYVSSPFTNATVNQFSTQLNLAASFPPFYSYTENKVSAGWNIYTTTTNALNPLSGYAANFGTATSPQIIFLSGTVNNGALSLSLTNNNQPYTKGFNLVGNPYPSPVDWNISSGWTKTNIDNALYFYNNGTSDQYAGTYSTYINGVSSIGGITNRNVIPAMQGFFVHVSNGTFPVSGTLAVNNLARNKLTTTFPAIALSRKPKALLEFDASSAHVAVAKPLARISIAFSSAPADSYDPAVIYFDNKKDQAFDQAFDALKLMNTDAQVPSLYLMSADQQRLSILALPATDQQKKTILLGLKLDKDESINFSLSDRLAVPFNHIYLNDAENKTFQELQLNNAVSIRLGKGVYENRFQLVFSNETLNQLPELKGSLNVYSSKGSVFLTMDSFTGEKGDVILYNMLGQEVFRQNVDGIGKHNFDPSLVNGVYILHLNSTTGTHTRNLLLAH